MRSIALFCEDSFHEKFVGALLARFEKEYGVEVDAKFYSARGGLSKMHWEFKQFLKDLGRDREPLPDCVIVVADANCLGFAERKEQMKSQLVSFPQFQQLVSYAIPDPHIERWMLLDPDGFKKVFTRGCTLPAIKCKKDEYKKLLRKEIRDSGIDAPLGGEEYVEDIVNEMDLAKVEIQEASLRLLLQELKKRFNSWKAL
jgi:hypothetical protein